MHAPSLERQRGDRGAGRTHHEGVLRRRRAERVVAGQAFGDTPRTLGPLRDEWAPTDFRDEILGRLGASSGTVMEFPRGREILRSDAFWLPPARGSDRPMALEVTLQASQAARRGCALSRRVRRGRALATLLRGGRVRLGARACVSESVLENE